MLSPFCGWLFKSFLPCWWIELAKCYAQEEIFTLFCSDQSLDNHLIQSGKPMHPSYTITPVLCKYYKQKIAFGNSRYIKYTTLYSLIDCHYYHHWQIHFISSCRCYAVMLWPSITSMPKFNFLLCQNKSIQHRGMCLLEQDAWS